MLFHMVQSVRADSIGATARQSMDGAERGTPVENLKLPTLLAHCDLHLQARKKNLKNSKGF